jgi:hypothetical protein
MLMSESESEPIPDYLDSISVNYKRSKGGAFDHEYVEFRFTGGHLTIDCSVHYQAGGLVFTVFAHGRDEFDLEKRDEMIKIANHSNLVSRYGSMVVGNPSDDKFSVWVRLSNASTGSHDPDVIDAMINNACRTMDLYYPAIMKLIWGGMVAEEAIKFAHRADDDEPSPPPPPISGYE